jgi:hypothetical protein
VKIYKNTHKGAQLMDAIDEYATAWESQLCHSELWKRVKVHMVRKLSIPEKYVTDKDLAYFVRRMGVTYLIRKIQGMTTVTAEYMLLWANKDDAQ